MNIRRLLSTAAIALCALSLAHGEVNVELAKKLFSAQGSLEDFNKAIEEAKTAGAPAQLLAEAKLVWGLRHKDTEFLTQITPELEAAAKNFKKEESAGLSSVEEFRALISYIKALDARKATRPLLPYVDLIATLPLDAAVMQSLG